MRWTLPWPTARTATPCKRPVSSNTTCYQLKLSKAQAWGPF